MAVRPPRTGAWIALWVLLVGGFVALSFLRWREDSRATASVTGRVVDESRELGFLTRSRTSWVVVDYRVSGRLFERRFGAANLPDVHLGDEVEVKYDPGDPLVANIPGARPGLLASIVVALAAPTVIVLTIRFGWRRRRDDRYVEATEGRASQPRHEERGRPGSG